MPGGVILCDSGLQFCLHKIFTVVLTFCSTSIHLCSIQFRVDILFYLLLCGHVLFTVVCSCSIHGYVYICFSLVFLL